MEGGPAMRRQARALFLPLLNVPAGQRCECSPSATTKFRYHSPLSGQWANLWVIMGRQHSSLNMLCVRYARRLLMSTVNDCRKEASETLHLAAATGTGSARSLGDSGLIAGADPLDIGENN